MADVKINLDPEGDTPRQVEDKVRALPENQGINEGDMWKHIDAEVEAVRDAGKLREVDDYHAPETQDVHGKV